LREDGHVSVHDAATGTLIWQRDLAGSAVGHLACDRQSVLVTLDDRLVLLDLRDGQQRWETPRTEANWLGSARLLGSTIAAPARDGSVLVYDVRSPTPRYRLEGDKKSVNFAIDAQGRVLMFAGRKVTSFRNLP
jgi:outer membrane protein assembly factor BamB